MRSIRPGYARHDEIAARSPTSRTARILKAATQQSMNFLRRRRRAKARP
jgi:hypothetical protein